MALAFALVICVRSQDTCKVSNPDKVDCGHPGFDRSGCENMGCCWRLIDPNPDNYPWCYHTSDYQDHCENFIWNASGPGFDDAMYDIMYKNFLSQLNVENVGAVMSSPDVDTPGGSYNHHWVREAGLSIRALLDINDNDFELTKTEVSKYAEWEEMLQHKPDTQVDIRVEPAFKIPEGDPIEGGWCRPQTDGPALRAMALSQWGTILAKAGQGDPAHIWSLVQFDLEWVLDNWESEGCDLWEEIRSGDFYFNKMAFVHSLNTAADFGDLIGQTSDPSKYRQLAKTIAAAASAHWNAEKGFIYESTNRPYDGSVIHAITTFGKHLFPPESEEAASTVRVLTEKFCKEYPINVADTTAEKPGILIGRYPGDAYAGGNPYQLLTAATAEFFYLGGNATLEKIRVQGDFALSPEKNEQWLKLLNLDPGTLASKFAAAQIAAGDSVLARLYDKVKYDGGWISEQLDRNTGVQVGAESFTWSYANILHALHVRKNVIKIKNAVLGF